MDSIYSTKTLSCEFLKLLISFFLLLLLSDYITMIVGRLMFNHILRNSHIVQIVNYIQLRDMMIEYALLKSMGEVNGQKFIKLRKKNSFFASCGIKKLASQLYIGNALRKLNLTKG